MDPRRSETAELADIHLAVEPGRDVWCILAILAYMTQNGLLDVEWLNNNCKGHEKVLRILEKVPVENYAEYAGIPMGQII